MRQLPIILPVSLQEQVDSARLRLFARIEMLVEVAHVERLALVAQAREHLNRCAGQRRRRQRERLINRTPLPAVFRSNRRTTWQV